MSYDDDTMALVERVAGPIFCCQEATPSIAALLQERIELALEEIWPDRWVVEYAVEPDRHRPGRMFIAAQIRSREAVERLECETRRAAS